MSPGVSRCHQVSPGLSRCLQVSLGLDLASLQVFVGESGIYENIPVSLSPLIEKSPPRGGAAIYRCYCKNSQNRLIRLAC